MAKIMERTYISANGVVEKTRYAVGDRTQPRRRKKGKTSLRKEEQNFNSSLRKVARILNCNYTHENGLLLTLDYDEDGLRALMGSLPQEQCAVLEALKAPRGEVGTWSAKKQKSGSACKGASGMPRATGAETGVPARDCHVANAPRNDVVGEYEREGVPARDAEVSVPYMGAEGNGERVQAAMDALRAAAEKKMMLWFRRIKRKCGACVKALMVTSDIDHETGEFVRVHHHVVLAAEGLSWDLLQAEWKCGGVDIRRLRQQPDYTPIAVYLMRQVRKQPEKKKYRVTQGMQMPRIESEREILSHVEIKPPAGARVLERSEFSADTVTQYIRYIPKKREYRRTRTAEEKGGLPDEV